LFDGGQKTFLDILTVELDLYNAKLQLIDSKVKLVETYYSMLKITSQIQNTLSQQTVN